MTDLYEALRAAIAPDGRVRLTLPLLTAMREEAERRERGESADGRVVIVARDVTFSPVDYSTLFARAETAERERDEARRELAEVRAFYARDRSAWADRTRAAEREADELRRDLRDLIAHARACLDPEIVSRDPAHARLAALLDRIDGS